MKWHFLKQEYVEEISETFANYLIKVNYPDFLSKLVIINYHEPKKGENRENRENEVSFRYARIEIFL